MNCSAEKQAENGLMAAFGRTAAAMVTVAAVALLGVLPGTALGGRYPAAPWAICSAMARPGTGTRTARRCRCRSHARPTRPKQIWQGRTGGRPAEEPPETWPEGKSTERSLHPALGLPAGIDGRHRHCPQHSPTSHGAGGCGGEDLVRL